MGIKPNASPFKIDIFRSFRSNGINKNNAGENFAEKESPKKTPLRKNRSLCNARSEASKSITGKMSFAP